MAKGLLILGMALQLALASGPCSAIEDDCTDGASDEQCSAACAGCVCCPHARAISVPAVMAALLMAASPPCVTLAVAAPSSPEPEDISHVPKPQFA